jgi:transcriptional regulator with XRE-family HTH domain
MSESVSDPKTTLPEFKEYVATSFESPHKFAARIGVAKETIWYWLSGRRQPKAQSLARLRRFLDAEAKRPLQGDGIRPVEPVPYRIIRPIQQVRYARICPFCRKERGKIRKLGAASFQGSCPKCGASGQSGRDTRKRSGHGMGRE